MPLNGREIQDAIEWKWLASPSPEHPNGRPVYAGTTWDGRQFVIKIETYEKRKAPTDLAFAEIRRSVDVMAEIQKRVAAKHPIFLESSVFPDFYLLEDEAIKQALDALKRYSPESYENATGLEDDPDNRAIWCMMDFLDGLEDFEIISDWPDDKKDTKRTTLRDRLNETKFESLGMIAAADWFIGNLDRFRYPLYKVMVTANNVFSTPLDMVGIDFFQSSSPWVNLYSRLAVEVRNFELGPDREAEKWPGKYLKDKASNGITRKEISRKVVTYLCDLVGKTKGISACVDAFSKGLRKGGEALEDIVVEKGPSLNTDRFRIGEGSRLYPPHQLWLRAVELGWMKRYDP